MMAQFHTAQLDILGFTEEYRLLFILTVGFFLVTFILVPFVRILVKRKYTSLLGFFIALSILSIIILIYEKYVGTVDLYGVWVKSMVAYSFLYAVTLFAKLLRKKHTA